MNEQEMKRKIDELERKVNELSAWKEARTRQQLTYPLDETSFGILNDKFLSIDNRIIYMGVGGREFPSYIVKQGGKYGEISAFNPVIFTANASTNVITASISLPDDTQVFLLTTGTLPDPLSTVIPYYIISSSGNTFKLSTSSGGSEVDITDTGTGIHFVTFI